MKVDPLAFYGLPPISTLSFQTVPVIGPQKARRLRFLLSAINLATKHREAVVFTRDLGAAAWLLQSGRSRLVYESHGIATTVAEEMPVLLGKPEFRPSARKLARLDRRERVVWDRASGYVTITHALERELFQRYGARPGVAVVPDGARPPAALPPPDGTRFVAGYAGHLYPWKGVDVFVRALALAPEVHGLIVGGHPGEADLGRVKALADSVGVSDRLTITGLVAPGDVLPALAPASVLVLPNTASAISERFTSPLKLFEYLTTGRPIVASDLPSLREVLTHDTTALLVPAGNEQSLAAAIVQLKQDNELRRRIGAAALALAPDFTWDKRAERLEAVLAVAQAS